MILSPVKAACVFFLAAILWPLYILYPAITLDLSCCGSGGVGYD